MGAQLHVTLKRTGPFWAAVQEAATFLLALPEAADHDRFLSRLVVLAAVAAGWDVADLHGYLEPRRCAFCAQPIPETLNARARYCRHGCSQAAYYERKVGRKTRSPRRADSGLCRGCGAEIPGAPRRNWCPECKAERHREAARQRMGAIKQRSVRPPPPPPILETRRCPGCQAAFVARVTSLKIYCTRGCKDRIKARRRGSRRDRRTAS